MMKATKFWASAGAILCGLALQADTLYWQVGEQAEQFTYAQVYATQNSDGTGGSAISGAAAMADGVITAEGLGTSVSPVISDIGNSYDSSWYFYVELVNNSVDPAHSWSMNQKYPWSYDQLVSSGYISTGSSMSTPYVSGALDGGSVPEPTSGILLLIGGSLLALRRRRR